jgi:hypothetical protein
VLRVIVPRTQALKSARGSHKRLIAADRGGAGSLGMPSV